MNNVGHPPWGRKVKLLKEYTVPFDPDEQDGDVISLSVREGKKVIGRARGFGPRDTEPAVIPANTVGEVAIGPYLSGVFDFRKEWPVQFGIKDRRIAETLGIPLELLQYDAD